MDGKRAASLFRSYVALEADKRAADAIEAQMRKLDRETKDALAQRPFRVETITFSGG